MIVDFARARGKARMYWTKMEEEAMVGVVRNVARGVTESERRIFVRRVLAFSWR